MASCGAATSAGAAAWGPAVSLRVGLSSGHEMPMLGLGTYQLLPEDLARVVPHALGACGYRLLDTAAVYKNEAAVGEAIRASGVPREEVFVTTKLHPKDHGEERAYEAALAALGRLGLDYIDLLLVHWPGVAKRSPADKGNAAARRSTWSGLQRLVEDGKARSIGVSNYTAAHLDDLCEWEGCTIRPAVNQIEVSPLCQQREIQAGCRRWGVHIQAYASLAQGSDALLLNPAVASIAAKHALSPSQLCLLWALQQGFSVIPRSRSTLRVTSNALPHRLVRGGSGLALSAKADGAREATAPDAVALADDELDAISALDPGDDSGRQCWNPNTVA